MQVSDALALGAEIVHLQIEAVLGAEAAVERKIAVDLGKADQVRPLLDCLAAGTERRDRRENLLDETDVDQVFGDAERGVTTEIVQQTSYGPTACVESAIDMQAPAEHVEPGNERRDFRNGQTLALRYAR